MAVLCFQGVSAVLPGMMTDGFLCPAVLTISLLCGTLESGRGQCTNYRDTSKLTVYELQGHQ